MHLSARVVIGLSGVFFFQAEDGIRDVAVTGVQTCALPISLKPTAVTSAPKFCIQCGSRLVAVREEGRTRRRCPRCGWTFYGNPVPAAVALVTRGGRLLLTRRARPPYAGTWDLPGGFLEAGGHPEAGFRRELRGGVGVGARPGRVGGFSLDPHRAERVPLV